MRILAFREKAKLRVPRSVAMKTQLFRISLFTSILLASLFLTASAQDNTHAQTYVGVAVGTGRAGTGKTLSFDFRIWQYTTDAELQSFAKLFEDQGTDALLTALGKENNGSIETVGFTGDAIAVARKSQEGADTIITIVTAHNLPFIKLYRNGSTTAYPFGYLQVRLDASGKGTGQIMAVANIRFDNRTGQYEIESYGNEYLKATHVRPL
jgi:hypothetical protein